MVTGAKNANGGRLTLSDGPAAVTWAYAVHALERQRGVCRPRA